ncbi:MAG: inositol monophosphatase [Gammaproteobacteria bacterium]|nr:inositol monophosphatase [Gammaproteobacteria bacterium]MCW8959231.1 inositol monophosphatase [Gammaproteobacteria bacterium]MCW8972846.1 inositol monophosphatase [Gammaproteobacteria bacterium]MCW8992081.1 inositol monophosphatase [Gammaproteobacteria bacterium]
MFLSIDTLADILRAAAREELLPRFAQVERMFKTDGSIVTEADSAMQQRIAAELAGYWPEISLLGEEMPEDRQQSLLARKEGGDGLWLLDPLDGTGNFAAGIPYFSVSLALVRRSRIELGIIYDPLRDECFAAQHGGGALLNGQPLSVPDSLPAMAKSMGLVDFKRLEAPLAGRLAVAPPYASQRSFGSGALDWCMIASGRCHLYLHGGQKLWDYAAGQLILTEAGGLSATLEGDAVFCNSLSPRSVVAAASPALFAEWQHWLREKP